MEEPVIFESSRIVYQGTPFMTGRMQGRDVILAEGPGGLARGAGLAGGVAHGDYALFPASYEHMLRWERVLAPQRRLVAVNRAGFQQGFGAGNRIVVAEADGPALRDPTTLGGWDGIHRAMQRSSVPFWYVQQSIVRELIPDGVAPSQYPGIGHTGGYGPHELLRAGLFAYASQGGYTQSGPPIGADADHAIVTGRNEEELENSLALNKLAQREARDYTKFTVDTCHLFDFPVALGPTDLRRVRAVFAGRPFHVPNILPGRPAFEFQFDEEEALGLSRKYWRACSVHKELFDHVAGLRGGEPFDYELSLDETAEPTPPRELLFYLVLLEEVLGLPAGQVASAGPNIGFIKRHDFEGDLLSQLWPQVNACASILRHFGAVLSVHSADGVRASTGKGPGVDAVLADATGGCVEMKVADVYQEVLWQVLAASDDHGEKELFEEAWRRTLAAVGALARIYQGEMVGRPLEDIHLLLAHAVGRAELAGRYGEEGLLLAQKTIGYGRPVFQLAGDLLEVTDPQRPDPAAELFRRFMFLTFRDLRRALFETVTPDGWQRLATTVQEATSVRLRGMGWEKPTA